MQYISVIIDLCTNFARKKCGYLQYSLMYEMTQAVPWPVKFVQIVGSPHGDFLYTFHIGLYDICFLNEENLIFHYKEDYLKYFEELKQLHLKSSC